MSIIADFSVPAEAFVLNQTLEEVPGIRIEVERVVAHTEESLTPYFRASGADFEQFESAMEDDPSIEGLVTLEEVEDERFYRAHWVDRIESLVYALNIGQAGIMDATGVDGKWEFRLLFPDHDQLSDFGSYCRDHDLEFELVRTFTPDNPATFGEYEVTDDQRDALVLAFKNGYFNVPRDTSTETIGDELGISAQAVSVRVRRGLSNLLKNTLATDE